MPPAGGLWLRDGRVGRVEVSGGLSGSLVIPPTFVRDKPSRSGPRGATKANGMTGRPGYAAGAVCST